MSVDPGAAFRFRLYVAGEAVNSAAAQSNLQALCRTHLDGRHSIEVVDVFSEPGRAAADGIFMTPTLVRLHPLPVRKVVGTLSDTQTLLQALNLPEAGAPVRSEPGAP
jgi:circadian clock protein KaiB